MIGILDYGVGNINAFVNIYNRLKIPHMRINRKEQVSEVTHLILPGVGAFDPTMEKFNSSGLREVVEYRIFEDKIPIIGICVGMQMLAKSSEEGKLKGLAWVDAEVVKFSFPDNSIRLPHMGWNNIIINKQCNLLNFDLQNPRFYFLHSYYVKCNDEKDIISTSDYYFKFCSAIKNENIYGVQFHPEKSHYFGQKLLENFSKL